MGKYQPVSELGLSSPQFDQTGDLSGLNWRVSVLLLNELRQASKLFVLLVGTRAATTTAILRIELAASLSVSSPQSVLRTRPMRYGRFLQDCPSSCVKFNYRQTPVTNHELRTTSLWRQRESIQNALHRDYEVLASVHLIGHRRGLHASADIQVPEGFARGGVQSQQIATVISAEEKMPRCG